MENTNHMRGQKDSQEIVQHSNKETAGKPPPGSTSKPTDLPPISTEHNAASGRMSRHESQSLTSSISMLSLQPQAPMFESPQTSLPQSDEEKALSQELALCDFRAYLLIMEAQNRERLRQLQGTENVYGEVVGDRPVDPYQPFVDHEIVVQADKLRLRRTELQHSLEQLTGRLYPMPDIYTLAVRTPALTCDAVDSRLVT
ncbi:uncharacterized protein PV09_03416 [Verruconis gallopava]|uniref:Uncharacterized protein n=1 Tax=Verruconis gallopava TaxID=253628 RepID=A0A0D1XS55_9PEZI|nr:uncharacterized protein PV09_03416 [Verruconis gallopava]KIW05536.1 hypothetical protein PV09_03416 [Verruconis gallopava]